MQARDLSSDFGKIVRILPDGQIPPDNPFVDRLVWRSFQALRHP